MKTAEDDIILLRENVALVQSHDVNSMNPAEITADEFFRFAGDSEGTVELEIAQSRSVPESSSTIVSLFGRWIESGDEDEQLNELYESRLYSASSPIE